MKLLHPLLAHQESNNHDDAMCFEMRHLLLKQGEIHQKLWDIDNPLQVEVILTAEQRVFPFLLESHTEHFISKAVGVWLLQALPI